METAPQLTGFNPQRILIIQTAFLGDLTLTTPLIEAVHRLWEHTEIYLLANSNAASLLDDHPFLKYVYPYAKRGEDSRLSGFCRVCKEIRLWRCDLALIPHRSLRSALIAFLARIPLRVGFVGTPGALFYTHQVRREPELQETARNLRLLSIFSPILGETLAPRLYPSEKMKQQVSRWLANHLIENEFIAFAPGSIWETKRWNLNHWIKLAELIFTSTGYPIIIVGGSEDRELGERICATQARISIAAGELSILESTELLSRAKLLITGDTAPLHLAVAMNIPVLAIFGPTVPEFGFAPTNDHDRIIGLELPCRPCAIHGSRRCPLKHHDCMNKLLPEAVFAVVREMLKS